MSRKPKIIAFAGSARKASFNQLLVSIAGKAAEAAGAEVELIDLADYEMPLFNEDLESEQGIPDSVKTLKAKFIAADGLLIASPEYNSSITPLLKNTIDWLSRAGEGEEMLAAYQGKAAAIMSASPGGLGGMRGLVHLRDILGNIGVLVIPQERAIGAAYDAFDESGELKDEKKYESIKSIAESLVALLKRGID